MATNDFQEELKNFIDNNKNKKFYNSNIRQSVYDKILERKTNKKRTNVKAITKVPKFCQYYLAACMLDYEELKDDIEDFIYEILDRRYRGTFKYMFSEVDVEMPEYRIIQDPRISYKDNKFYIYDKNNQYEATCDDANAEYILCPNIRLEGNCWTEFERTRIAPIGSISVSVPWIIEDNVIFDKNSGEYKIKDVKFYADYNLPGLSLVARYTGLHNAAWVAFSRFTRYAPLKGDPPLCDYMQHKDWKKDHKEVIRGYIYLFKGSRPVAQVKGDWDGYYNNLSFDKLKDLLEQIA